MDEINKKLSVIEIIYTLVSVFAILFLFWFLAFDSNVNAEDVLGGYDKEIQNENGELFEAQKIIFEPELLKNAVPAGFKFNRNLRWGSKSSDVRNLQRFLNTSTTTRVSASSFGSKGNETTFFGPLTYAAVIKFQELYKSEILTPVDLTKGSGFVGPYTRAKLNMLLAKGGEIPPPPPPPQGNILMITPGVQPVNSLVPERAVRVPFTKITLTSGSSSSIFISGFTVKRTGVARDSVLNGIVLLDERNVQLGQSKTLDSNHMATLGEQIVIPAGQSRTFTVAGNLNTNLSSFSGQTVGLSIENINTIGTTTIRGQLPVMGAMHTINSTLDIGMATAKVGTLGTSAITKEIGTQNHTFSSIIITAGSGEDIRIRSIRWRKGGSASASDISNLNTVIDGVPYSAEIATDGSTYVFNFGNEILVRKGLSKEISIRGNIESGTGRTIVFDIDRASDIYITGETFNFGILPSAQNISSPTDSGAEFTSGIPFFDGALVTISGASVSVSKSNMVPSQNIGIQTSGQMLGGFNVNVKGEDINIQNIKLTVSIERAAGSSAAANDIDDVLLTNQNGMILSGPQDAEGSGATGSVTFSDSINIASGSTTLIVKGRLGSDFKNGDKITISLKPSVDFMGVRGNISGNTITASPNSVILSNVMTIRETNINLSLFPIPISQFVVAGINDFTFANFIFDTTNSNEDVRLNSLRVQFTASENPEDINECRVFKGNENLTTGGNIQNPPASFDSGDNITFTFDSGLVLMKGTSTTLSLKCDISASADLGAAYKFGLSSTNQTVIGIESARTISINVIPNAGQTMTIATSGTLQVLMSSAIPSYQLAVGGQTATSGILRFRAVNEAVKIDQIGFELSGSSASSSPSDFSSITLWDGGTQVGTVMFSGINRFATSTLFGNFIVPQNDFKDLTIRAVLSEVGVNKPGTEGALIRVNYDGNNASSTKGTGVSSGMTIVSGTAADTNFPGVRLFKTVPFFEKDGVPTNTLANGERTLMRFKVSANNAGDAGIYKFTLRLATSSVSVSNINIFAFTDSGYSSPVSELSSGGQMDNSNKTPNVNNEVEVFAEDSSGTASPLQIPEGETRYFEVRAVVSGSNSGSSLTSTLLGDTSYPSISALMGTASEINSAAEDNFIWSPNFSGESDVTDSDWTNGFGIQGLPSSGISETLSR